MANFINKCGNMYVKQSGSHMTYTIIYIIDFYAEKSRSIKIVNSCFVFCPPQTLFAIMFDTPFDDVMKMRIVYSKSHAEIISRISISISISISTFSIDHVIFRDITKVVYMQENGQAF